MKVAPPGTLAIQGVSPAKTSLTQLSVESGGAIPSVVVEGVALGSGRPRGGSVDVGAVQSSP